MKFWSVFRKSMREQMRDIWLLSLILLAAPFFVFLYWMFFGSSLTGYEVLVLNKDTGASLPDGSTRAGGDRVVEAMKGLTYSGKPILNVTPVAGRAEAEARLKNRDFAALVIIPEDFSRAVEAWRLEPGRASRRATSVVLVGDLTSPQYAVAAVMANTALDQYIWAAIGQKRLIEVSEEPLGVSAERTELETYVPGLLIFAVIMLIFPAAMAVAREVEKGTLRRMQLTRMTSLDFLGGVSALQVLIGAASVVLTFLAAWALGFRSQGPLWVAILVGAVTSLSIVGVGLLVACFSRSVTAAFVIANFPMMLLMFFSGAIFPIPRVSLFSIGGHAVGPYDLLPPTHAVVALNKVLAFGAGLGDVAFELAALLILSAVYFFAGVWLFKRTLLRAQ